MKKKLGGQNTHWAEKVRVLVWYYEIKKRCNWTDYVLNYEFSWTEEGKSFRSPTHRSKVFEWIRKCARKPQGRDRRWHGMDGLVAAVEQHHLFIGTQVLYTSKFWEILQQQTWTPNDVKKRVEQLLETNDLVRIDPRKSQVFSDLINKYGREQIFDRCLMLSLNGIDKMSGMMLAWLLYLQTEPVHNSSFRVIVESIVDKQLDDFFSRHFSLDEHLTYYTNAINALLNLKLDLSERGFVGYGHLESYGVWPIIPIELSDTISENHLFYN